MNPACPQPENLTHTERCQACGSSLLLRDRYRVIQSLGQGGFGATFLAKDESLPGQPNCVIKQLRPTATAPHVVQMARELFEREAKTLGKIGDHPQVPRLLDYFANNQEFYLVQEYISGPTLQQEVKQNGPFTEAGVKQFLSELLPVLQYVHSQQVIHRDIKPANIIRRLQDVKLVLIDFGAVKDQVSQTTLMGEGGQTALTNFAIGTAGFAPPEQMAMRPVYASDIYALGVTCIYLLTGKSPKDLDYDPATGEMLWQKHVHASDHFISVLKKMLEVSVRHRYQSANEVLRALDMEPYLDSLANSMVAQPAQRPAAPPDNRRTSDPSSISRSAMAIRARQAKTDPNLQSGMTRQRATTGSIPDTHAQGRMTSGHKPKVPARWDANGLLNSYASGNRDFTSQDLREINLQKVDLSGAIFHEAALSNANLQGSNLFNANLGRANLNGTVLRNASLVKAYCSHADFQGADLRGANLTNAYLSNANLRGANLCGANLTGAKVTDEQLALAKTNWSTIRPEGKKGLWQ
ncbi:serine/threonine-protein kinase [Neosynechococcus sphagnicola]|uniref:serine/threonine-protein kinase n=1 Tax=Neosynechococcus sphagnicola TaxID=1501145 RepID=UPI00308441BF